MRINKDDTAIFQLVIAVAGFVLSTKNKAGLGTLGQWNVAVRFPQDKFTSLWSQ